VSARVPRTFAYRKAPAAGVATSAPLASGRRAAPVVPASNARATSPPVTRTPAGAIASAPPAQPPTPGVAEVQRLADAGHLERAADLCRAHLAASPTSAQGYYLLGVIESALGHRDAADVALRRAIYLDPGHAPALRQMAGERRLAGDVREADRFSRRADLVRARKR
jgi:chemotaxis protein methyltransferase WspC